MAKPSKAESLNNRKKAHEKKNSAAHERWVQQKRERNQTQYGKKVAQSIAREKEAVLEELDGTHV